MSCLKFTLNIYKLFISLSSMASPFIRKNNLIIDNLVNSGVNLL